jgi:hypothetical protein
MDQEIEQLKHYIVPVNLHKALLISRKLFGRIEWKLIEELGFLQNITREQIQIVYSKVNATHNTLSNN